MLFRIGLLASSSLLLSSAALAQNIKPGCNGSHVFLISDPTIPEGFEIEVRIGEVGEHQEDVRVDLITANGDAVQAKSRGAAEKEKPQFHTLAINAWPANTQLTAVRITDLATACKSTDPGAEINHVSVRYVLKLEEMSGILFDLDSSELTNQAKQALDNATSEIISKEIQEIGVEGHTCDLGSDTYNMKLSNRRAKAVATYLEQKSQRNKEDFVDRGRGESDPKVSNITDADRARNRRVELRGYTAATVLHGK